MILTDVNILIDAFRRDSDQHQLVSDWLEEAMNAAEPLGISDLVCSGFLRIVTNPRVYRNPSPLETALSFLELVRNAPASVLVNPGERHWRLFTNLCLVIGARGNLVPDAYFAALAIESGSQWITMDRDFALFPGLRWRRPF